ncbi:TIGR01244 family sulfur transferase [Parvularcula dongshanensis]|uniref:Uncharacterized protein (TIGR01244 family) n=1 Tax=Parvularcula dongshanensis TaxID=1173995 RepID=A0A840I4F6_9PROT|nr:TIGR01244 family sulfur transferase [Parvularcula dongshanensis]MBB4659215.1 uncharacterized protein (TIGR01244 family) [Parvularcula dongshanensis]
MFHTLEDEVAVSPQITASDVAEAARQGYKTIVSNRPDGEEPGQPDAAAIAAAAEAAGLRFVHVPIGREGPSPLDVEAMAAAIDASGKTLAYCRSGMRSATLWALARARQGQEADTLIARARDAGYDLSGLRGHLS